MIPYEQTNTDCLREMFRRVGETYPNEELTAHDEWYTQHTWTDAEQDAFADWMRKLLKKRYRHWRKRTIDHEVGMFVLMWGWKTTENT